MSLVSIEVALAEPVLFCVIKQNLVACLLASRQFRHVALVFYKFVT